MNLSRSPGWKVEKEGEELLLRHPSEPNLVAINPSAALIWDLCDGTRSIDDLEAELKRLFPKAVESIPTDLRQAISRMQRAGILRPAE